MAGSVSLTFHEAPWYGVQACLPAPSTAPEMVQDIGVEADADRLFVFLRIYGRSNPRHGLFVPIPGDTLPGGVSRGIGGDVRVGLGIDRGPVRLALSTRAWRRGLQPYNAQYFLFSTRSDGFFEFPEVPCWSAVVSSENQTGGGRSSQSGSQAWCPVAESNCSQNP